MKDHSINENSILIEERYGRSELKQILENMIAIKKLLIGVCSLIPRKYLVLSGSSALIRSKIGKTSISLRPKQELEP